MTTINDLLDLLDYLKENNLGLEEIKIEELEPFTQAELKDYVKWAKKYDLDQNNLDNLHLFIYKDDMGFWFDELQTAIENGELSQDQINAVYENKNELISEIKTSVEDEYFKFKEETLNKSSLEVYESYYEIHFYKEIYNFIRSYDDYDEEYLECLKKDKGHIIDKLYQYYLKSEYSSINNYEDMLDLLKDYCWRYHKDFLKGK